MSVWEDEARRQRAAEGGAPRKPTIRVRPGSGERELGLLTQAEVAAILRISQRTVGEIERRAFHKLRNHPSLREFWREWTTGEVKEAVPGEGALSRAEIAAVYRLARTDMESSALRKIVAMMNSEPVQRRGPASLEV